MEYHILGLRGVCVKALRSRRCSMMYLGCHQGDVSIAEALFMGQGALQVLASRF